MVEDLGVIIGVSSMLICGATIPLISAGIDMAHDRKKRNIYRIKEKEENNIHTEKAKEI